jgi:uncharacterized protein YchJ
MLPENAEQLMPSRYSAQVMQDRDYLEQNWHSDHRSLDLILGDGIRWIGLEVIDFQQWEIRSRSNSKRVCWWSQR